MTRANALTLEDDVRRLGGTRPLDALPREAVQLLAFSCEKRILRPGEKLFSQGEQADGAFFVLEGEIVLKQGTAERRARAGALIGESALLAETIRPSDAVAGQDATVLRIPREIFRRVLTEFPGSAVKVRRSAQRRAKSLISRLEAVRRHRFSSTSGKRS